MERNPKQIGMEICKSKEVFMNDVLALLSSMSSIKNSQKINHPIHNSEVLKAIMENAAGVFFIVNFQKEGYVYVSPNIKKLLGINPEDFYSGGLKFALTLFPLEHHQIFSTEIYPSIVKYCDEFSNENLMDLRFSYTTFIKSDTGVLINMLHQLSIIEKDEQGKPLLGLKFLFDINAIKKNTHVDFEVAKFCKTNNSYQVLISNTFLCKNKDHILTKRETEILKLISEGRSSKQISETMFISRYTVDNHRKNMLRKMNVVNTTQMLKNATNENLI